MQLVWRGLALGAGNLERQAVGREIVRDRLVEAKSVGEVVLS